jgi:predicted transcriptional regulator of viral defense system
MQTQQYNERQSRLHKLLRLPFFTVEQARRVGIESASLAYYVNKGMLERISRGVYRNPKIDSGIDIQWEDLVITAGSITRGVVCLISALKIYGLTDETMRQFWIAVPNRMTAPRKPNVKIVRMRNMKLGLTTLQFGEYKLKIFDRERTVVDSFRYLSRETAIKALRLYLRPSNSLKPNIQKLRSYAKELRVPLDTYILATMA